MKFIRNLFVLIGLVIICSTIYSYIYNDYDKDKIFVMGYKLNQVVSGSMSPTIETDDFIISKAINFDDIKVGDIISYKCSAETLKEYEKIVTVDNEDGETTHDKNQDMIIMHRVIEKTDKYIKTKGDANEVADPWEIHAKDVVSKGVYNISSKTSLVTEISIN